MRLETVTGAVPEPPPAADLNQKWFDPQWRASFLDWYVAHSSLMADIFSVFLMSVFCLAALFTLGVITAKAVTKKDKDGKYLPAKVTLTCGKATLDIYVYVVE